MTAPLIVIVGPTASGKTAAAIEIAQKCNGEILCADSRTVYRGMDIGTAKPTAHQQALVPHWGLDIATPGERFTAADFKRYADNKIIEIRSRGGTPMLVGGTGLYIDAIIFDYQFGALADEAIRSKFADYTIEQLHEYCFENNITLPENKFNKRYVIRSIEQKSISIKGERTILPNTIVVGITTEKQVLRERITLRTEQLFEDNVVQEAIKLGEMYGWKNEAMTGNIYPLVHSYLLKERTLEQIKDKFTTLDWRLAKRQLTWLHRNPHIQWMTRESLPEFVLSRLANE